jgi:hypothetical protein
MRNACSMLFFSLFFITTGMSSEKPSVILSDEPITDNEIAIYREILQNELKMQNPKENRTLNLANKTVPLQQSILSDGGCVIREIQKSGEVHKVDGVYRGEVWLTVCCLDATFPETEKEKIPIVHRLDAAVAASLRVVLVDPDKQRDIIDKIEYGNDPIKDVVERSFQAGLFTLSEILFNKERQQAVVSYGFHCGRLCGHGGTAVLKKDEGKWKISKRCKVWIS